MLLIQDRSNRKVIKFFNGLEPVFQSISFHKYTKSKLSGACSCNTIFIELLEIASVGLKAKDKKRLQKFRENLVRLRKQQGLSQRGLSYLCDIGHAKISRLESNEDSNLTLTTLFELAKGLGVHPKDLIDYDFDFATRRK